MRFWYSLQTSPKPCWCPHHSSRSPQLKTCFMSLNLTYNLLITFQLFWLKQRHSLYSQSIISCPFPLPFLRIHPRPNPNLEICCASREVVIPSFSTQGEGSSHCQLLATACLIYSQLPVTFEGVGPSRNFRTGTHLSWAITVRCLQSEYDMKWVIWIV